MITVNPNVNRGVIIAGIVIAFIIQIIFLILPSLFYTSPKSSGIESMFVFSRMLLWLSLLVMNLYSVKVEKQSFFLKEEKKYSFGFYILSIVLLIVISLIMSAIVGITLKITGLSSEKSQSMTRMIHVFSERKWLIYFAVFTAGIMEELMFRVYLLSRLELIFKNKYLPVIISSVLFGLIHFGYGTVQNIVLPIFMGVLFSLYYIRYRNIKVLIITHFLWDLILVSASVYYYSQKQ
ncbi:MAG TPA: CPBP family intramembrane metalloprotease [Panacibacter sp.]|nr:CPBP family intramembrane metalloprotease [Panacibacter sp.]